MPDTTKKKYSFRLQVFRESGTEGMLQDVTEVIVAADTITEAETHAKQVLGSRWNQRKIRVASIVEFAGAIKG